MPKASTPTVATGLTLLGYIERRPWLWLVDVDSRAIAPSNTSLRGNSDAVSAICTRQDWLAVQTQTVLWSVPLGLNAPGRRLRNSFTFVAALDRRAVWVEARPGARRNLVAVDHQDQVIASLELPKRWRLHADTSSGFVIEDIEARLLATFVDSKLEVLVEDVEALDVRSGAIVVWTRRDAAILGLTNVATGRTHEVRHPSVAEWQQFASFSPDGRYLAIGGYQDPPPRGSPYEALAAPYEGRPAFMALIETASGHCDLMQGEFDNFAWTPAWSADASWVVFGAPFQRRRLYAFRPDEGVLRALPFRRQPPMPMLDVTGTATVSLD